MAENFIKEITLFVLICFSLLLDIQTSSAQNLKKVFKSIESDEIEKAQTELNKFSDEVNHVGDDFILINCAECLLLCNENNQEYDPYKALETFEHITKIEFNKPEVNELLSKYELSIDKIKETICSGILNQAKHINTEASYYAATMAYYKARPLGMDCEYKAEVDTLWVNAAYKEAKESNTYEAYVKFYSKHGTSRYTQEVFKKFNEFEYQRAKRNGSLEALNLYINGHSEEDNPYLSEAIHLRDSIAYSTLSKSYFEYKEFLDKYPNSEYALEITKKLPELLYKQAISDNDIALMTLLISEYPSDSRVRYLRGEIERLSYLELLQNVSLSNFEDFKRSYPNSIYTKEISEKYNRILENSDIKKVGLEGPIKSITTTKYLPNENNRIEFEVKTEFNNLGKITYCEPFEFFPDDFNQFFNIYVPFNFEDENCVTYLGFGYAPNIDYDYSIWGVSGLIYDYDQNWLLTKASDGNTICKFFYNNETNEFIKREIINRNFNKHYIIKYDREFNESFKRVYYENGNLYRQFEYLDNGGTAIINEKNNIGNIISRVTIERDFRYLIVKRIIESSLDYDNVFCSNSEITYNYDANERLSSIHIIKKWKDYPYGNYNLPKKWKVTEDRTVKINRDVHGQITSWGNLKYQYQYDSYNNWIEATVYKVKSNDITIETKESVLTRQITYY